MRNLKYIIGTIYRLVPITALTIALGGARLKAQECPAGVVTYQSSITECTGSDYAVHLRAFASNGLFMIQNPQWHPINLYDGVSNKPFIDNNLSLTLYETTTCTVTLENIETNERCSFQSTVNVVASPRVFIQQDETDVCEGIDITPVIDGEFEKDRVTWTEDGRDIGLPPFKLAAGYHTLQVTVGKSACGTDKTASTEITYQVIGKPGFTASVDDYEFPTISDHNICYAKLPEQTENPNVKITGITNSTATPVFTTGPITWDTKLNPETEPISQYNGSIFLGEYKVYVSLSNACFTETKEITATAQQRIVGTTPPQPYLLVSPPPCSDEKFEIRLYQDPSNGPILKDEATFEFNPQPTEYQKPYNPATGTYVLSGKLAGEGKTDYTFTVPYSLNCKYGKPQSTTKIYTGSMIAGSCGGNLAFSYKYEYCPGDRAQLSISANKAITGVTIDKQSLFGQGTINNDNGNKSYTYTNQTTSDLNAGNADQFSPLQVTVTTADGTQAQTIYLAPRQQCGVGLEIEYAHLTDDNAICAGDTLFIKAKSYSKPYTITGLDLPVGAHTSGDGGGNGEKIALKSDASTYTKRFFTYHPYTRANPAAKADSVLTFVVHYREEGNTEEQSMTFTPTVSAKSCPPTATASNLQASSQTTLYSLGTSNFSFTLNNPTTDTTDEDWQLTYTVDPPQRLFYFETTTESSGTKKYYKRNYRAIPYDTSTYSLTVTFKEGDSIRQFDIAFTLRTAALDSVRPAQDAYCVGDDVEYILDLGEAYHNMLNQRLPDNPTDQDVAACFDWSSSPAKVDFKGRQSVTVNKETKYRYTFSTKADTGLYKATMTVRLRYQSSTRNPKIAYDTTIIYDLAIRPFLCRTGLELSPFKEDTLFGCQGDPIDLTQNQKDGVQVDGYKEGATDINTPTAYPAPGNSTWIYATVQADFHCAFMGPNPTDMTYRDSLYLITMIKDATLDDLSISNPTVICEKNSLTLYAIANGKITWKILKEDGQTLKEYPSVSPSQRIVTPPLTENVTVHAEYTDQTCSQASNNVAVTVVKRPTVTMTPDIDIDACPYSPVSAAGTATDGSQPQYRLFDLRAQAYRTTPCLTDADGLKDYPLQTADSLLLIYTNTITQAGVACAASDTIQITARAMPVMHLVREDLQQEVAKNETLCLPENTQITFTLTCEEELSYEWLLEPMIPNNPNPNKYGIGNSASNTRAITEPGLRLYAIGKISGCTDTLPVTCGVKPTAVRTSQDNQTVCPGTEAVFGIAEVANAEYKWYGPTHGNGQADEYKPQPDDPLYLIFHETYPADTGRYAVRIQRYGMATCTAEQAFSLSLYPTPVVGIISNNPYCQGEEIVLICLHGLTEGETPTYTLTREDGSEVSGGQLTNDRVIYRIPDAQPSDNGRYTFSISAYDCNPVEDFVDIEVDVPAVVRIVLNADSVCEFERGQLTAEITPPSDKAYTYQWYINDLFVEQGMNISVDWVQRYENTIRLEVIQDVCTSRADTTVTVIPLPILSGMPKDTGVCQGEPLFCLSPVSDIVPQEVIWHWINSDGRHTSFPRQTALQLCQEDADASMNGRYYAEVANLTGNKRCARVSDTTQLTVYQTPDIRIYGPTFICDGSTVTLQAVSYTPGTYQWKHNGSTDANVSVNKAGQYTVTRISEYGCRDSASMSLEARPRPYFSLPPDTSICRGTSFMIYGPDGMDAYEWNDGSQDKDILAENGGWYILTVYRNECPYSDSLYVHQSFCGQFHFPTAFTPNDNRVNDTWGAISAAKDEDMAEYDLMVFDRNGKKVFHGKRISEQWDGRYKGELCPPGVYMYSFKALEKLEGIKYQGNGTVTIIP